MGVPASGQAPVGDMQTTQQRLRRLVDANRSIVREVSLPAVLRRIVDAARDLTGARYAALAVLGEDGAVAEFLWSGLSDESAAALGRKPDGHGVLGSMLHDHAVVRIADVSRHEEFTGFPDGHPEVRSFLGVPIQLPDAVVGTLYLADRELGEFTAEDEDLMLGLAAPAGIAIRNAQLCEECRRRLDWLRARAAVSRHIVADDLTRAVDTITAGVRRLADADTVRLVRRCDDHTMEVIAAAGTGADRVRGTRYQRADSVADAAVQNGSGLLVSGLDGRPEAGLDPGPEPGAGPLMALPLMALPRSGERGVTGALLVGRQRSGRPFTAMDLELADGFAAAAVVALEVAEGRSAEQRLAVFEDRDRVARDLHDHVIQRLFAVGLRVQTLIEAVPDAATQARLADIIGDVDETIRSLRDAISTLRRPPAAGLEQTLRSAVEAVTPTLPIRPGLVLAGPLHRVQDPALMLDVEAVVLEGLGNVGRHAGVSWAEVRVEATTDRLEVCIRDDGCGTVADCEHGGLANLRRRAQQHGGTSTVTCPQNGGTNLSWTIPVTL